MSFLDHFRRKSSAADDTTAQPVEKRDPVAKTTVASEVAAPQPEAVPEARRDENGGAPVDENEKKSVPADPAPDARSTDERDTRIRFSVGDFLHRIPHQLLKHGPHDITFEVSFEAADVGDRIAQGQTTIPLVEVYKRAPHIFRKEILESDNIEIRFPWQKLMSFIKPENGGAHHPRSAPHAAAIPLATRVRSRATERTPPLPPPPSHNDGSTFKETARAAKLRSLRQPASWYTKPRTAPADGPQSGDASPTTPAPSEAAPALSAEPIVAESTPAPEASREKEPSTTSADATSAESTSSSSALTTGRPPESATGNESPRPAQPLLDLGLAPESPATPPDRPREQPREHPHETVELALLKAEHTRHMNELARERDALTAQRSELQSEVTLLRNLMADVRAELEQQKTAAAQRQEEIARAENARVELHQQIESRTSELAALQAEIDRLKTGNEEAVQTIAQERDALLQQKAYLTDQLTKVRQGRPGIAGPMPGAESGAAGDLAGRGMQVERSKREYQRQIEELQRRITAFESSQKESAHELSRERESRIKVERALAAAERARAEATALVENMRVESRRDLETGLRKRESELARTQQELQEQLDAANRAHEQAKADKQQLLTQLDELKSTAVSERDQLRARVAELEQSAQAAAPQGTGVHDWESRAVASLESDVEGYRARIKALLQERDAWNQERAQLAEKMSAPAASVISGGMANSIVEQLTLAQEKLRADLETVTEERNRLAAQLQKLEQRAENTSPIPATRPDERVKLEAQVRLITEERDAARQRISELERAQTARASETDHTLDQLRAQLGAREQTIAQLRASTTAEKENAGAVSDAAIRQIEQSARERALEFQKQIGVLRDENTVLAARVRNLEATAAQEQKNFRQQTEEIATRNRLLEDQLKTLSAESQRALEEMRRERDRLETEKAAARAAFVSAEAAHTAQKASLAKEHEAAIKRRDEAVAALEEASTRAQEAAEALTHEHMRREAAEAEAKERLERELARHQRERDLLQRQRDDLRSRLSRIVSEQSDLLDQMSDHPTAAGKSGEGRPRTTTAGNEEENVKVIEITGAEVVNAADTESNIPLPQARPVQTRPPEVRTG
jgi:chromosome segregation ATPase